MANVFDLVATLKLDTSGYKADIEAAGEEGKSKLGSVMGTIGKVGAAAIATAGSAAIVLGKQALDSYADYEQLVGGVDTLFKNASSTVQEYAANAYITAGLSANQYMETVTSFSASLLQSLGGDTEAAAKKADQAITDMSDNANKMGTSMESIQNAYQGFAKQNYTMLDNLKLGYGGTKEEMQRLLEDATALSGVEYDIESYADIVDAIHVVQTELGITGTTAEEASSTISGSLNSMKSAWQNLLTGIADDNADFGLLVDNFIESAVTVGENIIPRIETIIGGVGQLVASASERLLPVVITTITENLPSLLESGVQIVISLINGIVSAIPQIIEALPQIIVAMVNAIITNLPLMLEVGVSLIKACIKGIKSLLTSLPEVGLNIVKGLWNGTKGMISWAVEKFKGLGKSILKGIKGALGIASPSKEFAKVGKYSAMGLIEGMESMYGEVGKTASKMVDLSAVNLTGTSSAYNNAVSDISSSVATGLAMSDSGSMQPLHLTIQLGGTKIAEEIYKLNKQGQLALVGA